MVTPSYYSSGNRCFDPGWIQLIFSVILSWIMTENISPGYLFFLFADVVGVGEKGGGGGGGSDIVFVP